VFVEAVPKSPVGKILRRKLLANEFEPERTPPANHHKGTAA
jgi:2-furoate---CoA ligase